MRFWLQTAALLVALLAAFEVACRLVLGHSPLSRMDARYGQLTLPDQPIVQTREGFTRQRTNELGHLDGPMTNSPRSILVIGDSLTEGRQVSREERFTDRLGVALGVRVYNVGHVGWSPLNAIAFLNAERQRFAPTTSIVQISGNDLADITSRQRMHVTEAAGTFAIALPTKSNRGLSQYLDQSAFASLAFDRATAIIAGGGDEAIAGASCTKIREQAKRALPWMFSELRRVGGDVRVVYLPALDYHGGCIDQCLEARGLFVRAAAGAGVRFIDATGALCVKFAETRQPLHGFWNTVPGRGHLNAEGHAVVASVLAAELRK